MARFRPSNLLRAKIQRFGRAFANPSLGRKPLAAAVALAVAAAAAVSLVSAQQAVATAASESVVSLVKNTGQTPSGTAYIDNYIPGTKLAQAFTTGGNAGGYTLTGIGVVIKGTASADQRAALAVQLWSDSGGESAGQPGAKLADLTVPSSVSTGTVLFAAPSNTTLSAGTTYHLVIDAANVTDGLEAETTASDAEDSGAAAGWSIANDFLGGANGWPDGYDWSTDIYNTALRIEVNGYANTQTAPTTTVAATENAAQQSAETESAGGVSFDAAAASQLGAVDRVWTVGARVDRYEAGKPDGGLDRLPEADVVAPPRTSKFELTYSAAGLPAGLTMGNDRVIRGTPVAATDGEVTVTLTASGRAVDADGKQIGEVSTASLQFQATVMPPVVFDAASLSFFTNDILEYTVGQAAPLNVRFPRATGGEGPLTYWLDNKDLRVPISSYATGLSFDPAVPALTSSTGNDEPVAGQSYALTYWAEDSNGARAVAYGSVAVAAAPELPIEEIHEIIDKTLTVGQPVSITLPEATGGSKRIVSLQYRVEPQIPGLRFDPRTRTLSGTPTHTGQAAFDYTVTDRNGVSGGAAMSLTIAAGASAPTAAPQITARALPASGLATLDWDDVDGATGYVVQMRASYAFFPSLAADSVPYQTTLLVYPSRSQNEDGTMTRAVVFGLSDGAYQVRVAAVNADGAGPWSSEASVTLPAEQDQGNQDQSNEEPQFYGGSADGPSTDKDLQRPQVARVVPGPVPALELTATTSSVTVSWQPPEAGDAPERYIVHLKPEGGKKGSGKTKNPKAKKTKVTFKNLKPGTTYNVWVRAQNQAGKGERVTATITLPQE